MVKFKKWSGIILQYENEILLCKRSEKKSLANTWSIPSGKVESGETPGHAAIREFYEETNIKLDTNIDFVGFIDKFKNDELKKGHMFVFHKKTEKKLEPNLEEAKDGFEHTECRYFKKDNLPKQKNNEELIDLIKRVVS